MDKTGGTDADIKARKGKARSATLSSRLKVRAYNATIEPVLLYGSETRRMNNTPTNKVLSFVNTCPHTLARDYLKYLVVGKNKPSTCQGWHYTEKVEVDRPYSSETWGLYHKKGAHMVPPRIAEKRQTKKHMEKRSRQGASQDGCDLGVIVQDCRGQGWIQDFDRRPMFPGNQYGDCVIWLHRRQALWWQQHLLLFTLLWKDCKRNALQKTIIMAWKLRKWMFTFLCQQYKSNILLQICIESLMIVCLN